MNMQDKADQQCSQMGGVRRILSATDELQRPCSKQRSDSLYAFNTERDPLVQQRLFTPGASGEEGMGERVAEITGLRG